jgi:hypothetical protein
MPNLSGVELLDGRTRPWAVRAARTFSAVVSLGCAIAAAALLSRDDVYLRRVGWGWLTNAGISGVAFVLLVARRHWSAAQAQIVSLVLVATTLVAQVHADWTSALSQARFAAFEGFKAVALAVATLAPFRPALSYGVVGTCAITPLALYAVMPAPMRANLPVEAPWTVLVYPLLGAGILMYRVRALRTEREVMRAHARREQLERFAKVSLAYRDLVNSPLQTIELLCAVLRRDHPDSKVLLDRLRKSASRLTAMGEMLSRTEHRVAWTSKEEAFDAAQVIEEYHRATTA